MAAVREMLVLMCRAAEAEKERLSLELDQVWAELSNVVRAVYHLDSYPADADADTVNSDRLSGFVSRQVSTQFCILSISHLSE